MDRAGGAEEGVPIAGWEESRAVVESQGVWGQRALAQTLCQTDTGTVSGQCTWVGSRSRSESAQLQIQGPRSVAGHRLLAAGPGLTGSRPSIRAALSPALSLDL